MVDRPRNERMEDGRGRGKDIFIRTVCIRIKVHPKWHTFLVLHMYSLCAHFSLFLILSMFSKSQPLLINCLIFYLMFALSFVHIPFLRSFSPRCFIQSLQYVFFWQVLHSWSPTFFRTGSGATIKVQLRLLWS